MIAYTSYNKSDKFVIALIIMTQWRSRDGEYVNKCQLNSVPLGCGLLIIVNSLPNICKVLKLMTGSHGGLSKDGICWYYLLKIPPDVWDMHSVEKYWCWTQFVHTLRQAECIKCHKNIKAYMIVFLIKKIPIISPKPDFCIM